VLFRNKPADKPGFFAVELVDGFAILDVPGVDVRVRKHIGHWVQRVHKRVSHGRLFATSSAESVHCFRQWNDQYGRDLEGVGRNCEQQWRIYGALRDRELHSHSDQFSGSNQIDFGYHYSVTTDANFGLSFTRHNEHSTRGAATIQRIGVWDKQHSCDVERIRRNGHHGWAVHCAVDRRNLHRDCD
jgi:hypothetical protein